MMNGAEKSDLSIVPGKPANKVERSAAELGEGSDRTKRNAELQSTDQTQGWESVSQAGRERLSGLRRYSIFGRASMRQPFVIAHISDLHLDGKGGRLS
jgi:hypothetical protein